MGRKRFEATPGFDIPNPDAFVERSGHDHRGLRVEVAAEYVVCMSFEGFLRFTLKGCGSEQIAISFTMTTDDSFYRREIPNAKRLVVGATA